MDKAYDHADSENNIYAQWERSGAMRADETSDKPPFTIPLPPPNVTGNLHLGHAAMLAIEDILIRYKRMRGHEVLWVPGTDHAAIATENVVLRHLGAASREEYSREEFLGHCRQFASEKHDNIVNQMKKMGSWLDWSREAYTFDEARNHAVNHIFRDLYNDGLIERGHRLINWSVGAQSVLSDDELEYDEVLEPFYYIRCGEFVIGTVRPETKCADSPVVVHPDSKYLKLKYGKDTLIVIENLWKDQEKFFKTLNFLDPKADYQIVETKTGKELEGQKFEYDTYAGKRQFYVLADEVIDPEKGAGAMTISSSHSADDYDLAKRRGLDETFIQKVDFDGKMTDVAGPCAGLDLISARKKSGRLMEEAGLLLGLDKSYQHRVPLCYRSNCVVEPMISPQWFIMVEKEYTHPVDGKTTLKAQMQAAVRDNHVSIVPDRFNKEYFRWIDNLQDWCISRQIWWGHRIPVWYDEAGGIHLPEEKEVILVRHCESLQAIDTDGIIQSDDTPLSEKGLEQAQKLANELSKEKITKVISSDAKRSLQTAEAIAAVHGIEVEIRPEFRATETSLKGKKRADYYDKKTETLFEANERLETGETRHDVWQRLIEAWEKLKNVKTEGKIVVVSHRSVLSGIDTYRAGGTPDDLVKNRLKNDKRGHDHVWGRCKIFTPPIGENLRQDEDTLDTWFSSALWPFSTLGWPDKNAADFNKFYPTDVLETGWDILFFWVARMIMFGRYATGEYPFHTVYLHGMVTDEHGKKMSKSKGNGIDPLDMINQFGTDPVRLALVIGSTPGNPIPIGENKIKGYRNFVNKLWNAARFVQMQVPDQVRTWSSPDLKPDSLADRWLLSRLTTVSKEVSEHLKNYEISSAGDKIYHFVWGEFCDWYLEASKAEMNPAVLQFALGEILKLTHPLCPFITEKLWQELFEPDGSLMDQVYPDLDFYDQAAEHSFAQVQNIVSAIRQLRADKKLNPKEKFQAFGDIGDLGSQTGIISLLANLSSFDTTQSAPESAIKLVVDGLEIFIDVPVDEAAEADRITKEKAALEAKIANLKGRLANKSYTEKAPAHLVDQTKAELAQAQAELEKI